MNIASVRVFQKYAESVKCVAHAQRSFYGPKPTSTAVTSIPFLMHMTSIKQ